jgi:hypothetical protein
MCGCCMHLCNIYMYISVHTAYIQTNAHTSRHHGVARHFPVAHAQLCRYCLATHTCLVHPSCMEMHAFILMVTSEEQTSAHQKLDQRHERVMHAFNTHIRTSHMIIRYMQKISHTRALSLSLTNTHMLANTHTHTHTHTQTHRHTH